MSRFDPVMPTSWQARNRQFDIDRQAEEAMRERPLIPAPAANVTVRLESIERARHRIAMDKFYAAHGRRHPQNAVPPVAGSKE